MRSIHANLATEQVKMNMVPAYKVVLTKAGEDDVTFDEVSIMKMKSEEEPWSNKLKVIIDNSDKHFETNNYEGWQIKPYYGNDIPADTKRYSIGATLWCVVQDNQSSTNGLIAELEAWGAFDIMGIEEASSAYLPEETDTKTVKTLLQEIAGATMACFNHCLAIPITFDSEDSLVSTYMPKDSFRVYEKGSRLAAFRWLLDRTGCVARYRDDGYIHVFVPTISGSTYDMEFKLDTAGYPNFYLSANRSRTVFPNYVVVQSYEDSDPFYSGYATDGASLEIREYQRASLQSSEQATSMAQAILSNYKMWEKSGYALTPLITNLEVMDYIKVTDSRSGTSMAGNLGRIVRNINAVQGEEEYTMSISFGGWLTLKKTLNDLMNTTDLGPYFARLQAKELYVENLTAENIGLYTMDDISDGEGYGRVASTSIVAGKIILREVQGDLDDIVDGTTYGKISQTDISSGHIILSTTVQSSTARFSSDAEKAYWTAKPETMDQIGEGTTYQKVRATDIDSGHIKLTSYVVAEGEWYNEGGVVIDADEGVTVYYDSNNYVRLASNGFVGVGGGLVQVLINAEDGTLIAGAGDVVIDRNGVKIISSSASTAFRFNYFGANAFLRFDGTRLISSANMSADKFVGTTSYSLVGESGNPFLAGYFGSIFTTFIDGYSGSFTSLSSTSISTIYLGSSGTRVQVGYFNVMYASDIGYSPSGGTMYINSSLYPSSIDSLSMGSTFYYWYRICAHYVMYKTLSAFDSYNDIELIRSFKNAKDKGRDTIDLSSLPEEMKEVSEKGEVFANAGAVAGLSLGAIKQMSYIIDGLIERIEKLEGEKKCKTR